MENKTVITTLIEFNTTYALDNLGRVYSILRQSFLKPFKTSTGYWAVRIPYPNNSGDKGKQFYIHKLVAENFVSNPFDYKFISFIDGDIANFQASNLRYVKSSRDSNNFK